MLGESQRDAPPFKQLATLRTDASVFGDVGELRRGGPTPDFAAWGATCHVPTLLARARQAQAVVAARQAPACSAHTLRTEPSRLVQIEGACARRVRIQTLQTNPDVIHFAQLQRSRSRRLVN